MIHLLNISTCYILFLIISLASHASPCLTALEAEVSSVSTHHQELNPSPEFLEGVEFVERVIADIPNYQSQRTKRLSVWGEYKNQLRSRGVIPPFITIAKEIITSFIDEIKLRIPGRFNFSYNNTHRSNELFDLIIALEDALDGKDWKYVFALSNNVLTESIIKYLQEIHLSGARLFLTWEVLV